MIPAFLDDVTALAQGELPSDVRATAACCIFDWFGVALAGAHEPMLAMLRPEIVTAAGEPSSLIGSRERTSPSSAALYNGAAGDALDFSDCNRTLNGHATATVFPAALAIAQATDASGDALLRAFVGGVEAACRVGRIVGNGVLDTPLHPTAVAGPIGAALAAGVLLTLDERAFAHALGIAGTQAAGLADAVGTMSKPLHAGTAAAAGTLAARLAARGFTGPANILEPNGGFLRLHTRAVEHNALAACRGEFLILQTLMKAHAACALAHGSIDNMLRLKHEHTIDPASVEFVELTIAASSARVCGIAEPRSGLEAKFSVTTVTAMALLGYDTSKLATFADGVESNDEIARLRARIAVIARDDLDVAISRAHIRLRDGRTLETMTDERIIDRDLEQRRKRTRVKFLDLTVPFLSQRQAAEIEDRIFGLDASTHFDPVI